jgi:hypothetical protein
MRDIINCFYRAVEGIAHSRNITQNIDINIIRTENSIEVKEIIHNGLYWREIYFGVLWKRAPIGAIQTKVDSLNILYDLWQGNTEFIELPFVLRDSQNEFADYSPNDIVLSGGVLFKPYRPISYQLTEELNTAMKTSRSKNSFRELLTPLQRSIEFDDGEILEEGDFVSSDGNLFKPIFDHILHIYDILTETDGSCYLVLSDSDVTGSEQFTNTQPARLRRILNPPEIEPGTGGLNLDYYMFSNNGLGDGHYGLPGNILANIPVIIRRNKEVWLYIGGENPQTNKIRLQDKSPNDSVFNIIIEQHPLLLNNHTVWYYRCHNPNYIIIVGHKYIEDGPITLTNSVTRIRALPKFQDWQQIEWDQFTRDILLTRYGNTTFSITDPNIRQNINRIWYLEMGTSTTAQVRCPIIFQKENEPENQAYVNIEEKVVTPMKKKLKTKFESPQTEHTSSQSLSYVT